MFQIGMFAEFERSIIYGLPGSAPGLRAKGKGKRLCPNSKNRSGRRWTVWIVGVRSQDAREIILFVMAITSSAGRPR
jgi:hypothetical protein